MAAKTTDMTTIKQVLILHQQGVSNREIARRLSLSKNTVNRYMLLAENDELSLQELLALDEPILDFRFNGGSPAYTDERFRDLMERLPYFERELSRKHVTARLLWEEYRREKPNGYSLTQFRYHLSQHRIARKDGPSTLLKDRHEGGDKLYIDFAGDRLEYVNRETGEVVKVQLFVAVLPASDYAFAMAVPTQNVDDFCHAVDSCLRWLGGAPRQLVCDNLKSAVVKPDRYCPTINNAFEQLANHYGCAISPARVRHPKDKAQVENGVKLMYQRVYAPLRNRTFYDLPSLNQAIFGLVRAHNEKRIQNDDCSRQERFAAIDAPNLLPLPAESFDLWRTVTLKVARNSHIRLGCDRHFYSVPHQYIGANVIVKYNSSLVKVYLAGQCVATHQRCRLAGRYTTIEEHLPSHSRAYRGLSPITYIGRAERVSPTFKRVIELLFSGPKCPELYYRSADGLFALQRSTDTETFETACQIAIERERCNYPYIRSLVMAGTLSTPVPTKDFGMPEHGNIRGKSEYQ